MKKYVSILLFLLVPLTLFAQMNISHVDTIIKDSNQQSPSFFSSPLALGFTMYRIHMSLAYGSGFSSLSSYEYANLVLSLKDAASYNILDLLEFETDKIKAFDSYISYLDQSLLQSDMALITLKEEMSLLQYSLQNCLTQKATADKQYLDALQFPYQQSLIENSLEDSKKNAQCASDAKIEYNAKKVILDKIVAYQTVIKTKYDYLSAHRDDIVVNYTLIKGDDLNRLILIKRSLEKYDY